MPGASAERVMGAGTLGANVAGLATVVAAVALHLVMPLPVAVAVARGLAPLMHRRHALSSIQARASMSLSVGR